MAETIEERVKEIICEELGLSEEEVTLDSSFTDDLGGDCLDVIEMVGTVEVEYNIKLPDEVARQVFLVRDLIVCVKGYAPAIWVRELLSSFTNEETIQPDASLVADLGADSYDLLRIFIALEEELGIDISDEDEGNIRTVQDLVSYIERRKEGIKLSLEGGNYERKGRDDRATSEGNHLSAAGAKRGGSAAGCFFY